MKKEKIILITIDCFRPDFLKYTKYTNKLGKNLNAYTNGPGTRWAFPSLLTGIHHLRMDQYGIGKKYKSIAQYLKRQGYQTGAFVNNALLSRKQNYHKGFDKFFGTLEHNSGWDGIYSKINKYFPGFYKYDPANSDKPTVDQAIEWAKGKEKYFVWIHLMDAHTPYILNGPGKKYTRSPAKYIKVGKKPPQSVIKSYIQALKNVDRSVSKIDKKIDSDILILTADHGESFGEHVPFHQPTIFNELAKVPLIIKGIDYKKPKTAQHIDIVPTILNKDDLDGRNLRKTKKDVSIVIAYNKGLETKKEVVDLAVVWKGYKIVFENFKNKRKKKKEENKLNNKEEEKIKSRLKELGYL